MRVETLPEFSLAGKVALITGAARGQGEAEARAFVEAGAKVVLTDVLDDLGQSVSDSLGDAAVYLHQDVAQEQAWSDAMAAVLAKFGKLDVLVNNAAVFALGGVADTELPSWDRHLAINQTGAFLGMRAASRLMRDAGGGSIINVSSVGGMRAAVNVFAYVATKWALRGMSLAAAKELVSHGIRVNTIFPGLIRTPMLDVFDPEVNSEYAKATPMGRYGEPRDIASAALFLASDASSFMTGGELVIDGGFVL